MLDGKELQTKTQVEPEAGAIIKQNFIKDDTPPKEENAGTRKKTVKKT